METKKDGVEIGQSRYVTSIVKLALMYRNQDRRDKSEELEV
jgi:hypothetical protein